MIKVLFLKVLLPLKYLLLIISYLFPRNKKIWCFGSTFHGNAKYLFIYMTEEFCQDYKCIWIGENKDVQKVKSLGFDAFRRWSFRGLYYTLRGGVYVYNSYPANVNLYTMGGAKLVNLWHGIALKCIDRQVKSGPTAKFYHASGLINRIRYVNFRKHANVVLSTSPLMSKVFSEAFDVPLSKIVEGIYPRCSLFNKSTDEIIHFISTYEDEKSLELVNTISKFGYTYIYMPTWRDTGDDFISQCGFDFNKLNEVLNANNRLLILKLHPDSKLEFELDYSNIKIIDKDIDIYPFIPFTNCLITDFSSIYFDYLLMNNKEIILFIPDYDDYISKNRALNYPYNDVMKGIKVYDFDSLLQVLSLKDTGVYVTDYSNIKRLFWNPICKDMRSLVSNIVKEIS